MASPAIRGTFWTIGGYGLSQLLRLGGNILLARLLFPAAFGEMALVFTFIAGLQMFSDVGIIPSIVQNKRGDDARFLDTAWTIQCVRGALLFLASCAIAWPAATFYGLPSLRWLIPAGGLNALIAGFESTSVALHQRHLRLERLTVLEVVSQTVGLAASLGLVVAFRWRLGPEDPTAVWAIIAGSWVSSATRLFLSHAYLEGQRNRLDLEREAAHGLLHFGRWIFVSTLLTFLAVQADRLVFGKLMPVAMLGVYSIAATLGALPTEAVFKLGSAVVFPTYSRLVGRADFGVVFWRVRLPLALGGACLAAVLLAGGPFLVRFLYDARYADAGWMLQFVAVGAWFRMLEVMNSAALLAQGRVRWMAAGNAAKVAGMVALVPLGFSAGGVPGALAGMAASDLLKYLASATGAARGGLRVFGRDVVLSAAVAATSLGAFALGTLAADRTGRNVVGLLVSPLLAGAPWGALALLLIRRRRVGGGDGVPSAGAPAPAANPKG